MTSPTLLPGAAGATSSVFTAAAFEQWVARTTFAVSSAVAAARAWSWKVARDVRQVGDEKRARGLDRVQHRMADSARCTSLRASVIRSDLQ